MNQIHEVNIEKTTHSHFFHIPSLKISWETALQAFNRITMFVVFFWFGFLKVISVSPAEQLVSHLHAATIGSLISQQHFMILLGLFECLIGIVWLFPRYTKIAFWMFAVQMFTTFLPFVFISGEIVQNGFQLSLAGQYIVKNIVLVSCALNIVSMNIRNKK